MRWTVVALCAAGCMTGDGDSHEVTIVEGDWVMAPSLSDEPMLADDVPAGIAAAPVEVRIVDGRLAVCKDGVPMDGTEDGDSDAPRGAASAAGGASVSGGLASDALGTGGYYAGGDALNADGNVLWDELMPDWDPTTVG